MSLRELYQEIILDHGKTPRNFGELKEANHYHLGHNPLCGDKLIIYVAVREGVIHDLRFKGTGCAISMASASLMTEVLKGKTLAEAQELFQHFHHLVTVGTSEASNIGKLAVFAGVAEFPIRVKCATLAWHTLTAALKNDPHPVSTE